MKRLFFLVNVALLLAVLASAMMVRSYDPESRWTPVEPFDPADPEALAQEEAVTVPSARAVALQASDTDEVWENTLFDPRRTEEEPTTGDTGEEAEKRNRNEADMELIGIGKLNKRQAAIILVKERRRRGSEDGSNAKRNVYTLDDKIQNSGYVLVRIGKSEVELQRDEESRILALKSDDPASQQRNKRAAAAATARAKKAKQEAASERDDASSPPPPPPPPAPGGAKTPSRSSSEEEEAGESSRRERIRRALEARRRLLEKRRKAQQQKQSD